MTKNKFQAQGTVTDCGKSGLFWVELENGHKVLCTPAGKLRINHIRLLPEDRVEVELDAYDLTKGRIIYRYKDLAPTVVPHCAI
jgi:translation initiation factor IF-1